MENFGANEVGEHEWIKQQRQLFVRTRVGWPDHREVARVLVAKSVDGEPFVALAVQKARKTRSEYTGASCSIGIHSRDDYLKFMQRMLEAGKRAGFIANDVDVFVAPSEQASARK